MANDDVGLNITKYLIASGEEIIRLYLHEKANQSKGEDIIEASNCKEGQYFLANCLKDAKHIQSLQELNADFIITVYWAHLLSNDVIQCANDSVNFHPAPLPINKGWYPHVHSIIDGSALGVTLHRIEIGADTGPIWAQKKLELGLYETSKEIYQRLKNEIFILFAANWGKIKSGEIQPVNQVGQGNYHKKNEIQDLDCISLEQTTTAKSLINKLRARSFGNKGFAYYVENGERVYLNLRMNNSTNFEKK